MGEIKDMKNHENHETDKRLEKTEKEREIKPEGAEIEQKLNDREISFGSFVSLCLEYCRARRASSSYAGTAL